MDRGGGQRVCGRLLTPRDIVHFSQRMAAVAVIPEVTATLPIETAATVSPTSATLIVPQLAEDFLALEGLGSDALAVELHEQ
ncbi:MAG: hypothetical protein H7240_00250 [Glaciimonas sp.]|nr:hypothetical protein [Glaciimonas sp.]